MPLFRPKIFLMFNITLAPPVSRPTSPAMIIQHHYQTSKSNASYKEPTYTQLSKSQRIFALLFSLSPSLATNFNLKKNDDAIQKGQDVLRFRWLFFLCSVISICCTLYSVVQRIIIKMIYMCIGENSAFLSPENTLRCTRKYTGPLRNYEEVTIIKGSVTVVRDN